MFSQTTKDIKVTVEPVYLDEQSEPHESYYVWAYHIIIQNQSNEKITLCHRYWRITDGNGNCQEVSGKGVVGETPSLNPGDSFEYTSSAPLNTPTGFMQGTYDMENEKGEIFNVEIPLFPLDTPYEKKTIN